MRGLSWLVAGFMLVGCSAAEPTENVAARPSPILGGSVDDEHRAVMALTHRIEGGYALCTASVFHVAAGSALLVTAAHCVVASDDKGEITTPPKALPARELHVTAGRGVDGDLLLEREYPVVGVSVAPGYNGFLGNPDDVAIVRIVGASADFPRLPLLTTADAPADVAEAVTLVGYGQTEDPDESGTRRVTTQNIAWLDQNFIGFDQSDGRGLCHGDSGGPVLVSRNEGEAIAAVNSLARGSQAGDCVENATSVQVGRHAAQIEQAIAAVPQSLDCASCKLAEQAPGHACGEPVACAAECAALVNCLDDCTDRLCAAVCASAHQSGVALHQAALSESATCAERACAETCRNEPATNPSEDGCSFSTRRHASSAGWTSLLVLTLVVARRRARRRARRH